MGYERFKLCLVYDYTRIVQAFMIRGGFILLMSLSDKGNGTASVPNSRVRTGSDDSTSRRRTFLKGVGTAAAAAGLTATSGCLGVGGSQTPTISLAAWGNYEQLKDPIEEKLDVQLEYTNISNSSQMFSSWNAGENEEFDLTAPVPNWVGSFVDADLIAPLDTDVATNFEDIYDNFTSGRFESQMSVDGTWYGLPTRFGWYGYSYHSRKLPEDHEESYEVLFSEEYEGVDLRNNIITYDAFDKAMWMTALYLGYEDSFSGNTVSLSDEQLENVKQTLIEQKEIIGGYISADSTYITSFRNENHIVGQCGRNEIAEMESEGDDWVRMAQPKEGELAWTESFVVSNESDNQEMAWRVANEYLDPEIGAEWAENNATPNVNPKTIEHMSDEGQELYAFSPDRIEGMIPFMRIENEDDWIAAWEEIKVA